MVSQLVSLFLVCGAEPQIEVVNRCPPALTVTNKCPAPVSAKTGYPLRSDPNWWDMGKVKQKDGQVVRLPPTAEHLAQGQHKFPLEWLKTLSQAELTALHSDDHEGRVKWDYVSGMRASTRTASPSPPPVVSYTPRTFSPAYCPPGSSH